MVCDANMCTGCMTCRNICPTDAITIRDSLDSYNACIDEKKCINCNACYNNCPQNFPLPYGKTIFWKQGWANEKERETSSSGGVVAAISQQFIQDGGVVVSCSFKEGNFSFESTENLKELYRFKGSKYVKSNPGFIYKDVRSLLLDGKKVLFIGLPCQIAGVKKYVGPKNQNNLYTVDLICHGTPSPQILEKFLEQYGVSLSNILDIQFRNKGEYQLTSSSKSFVPHGVTDRYTVAFLKGLIFTENCYSCKYAREERISDITVGDSWGSDLASDEKKKGISLIMCQTQKGKMLVEKADLRIFDVNKEVAVEANHQLKVPCSMPKSRLLFFNLIRRGKGFNASVSMAFPKICFKQDVKKVLTYIHFTNKMIK